MIGASYHGAADVDYTGNSTFYPIDTGSAQLNGVTIRDPRAVEIHDGVEIGAETVIERGVVLRGKTRIGRGCTIDVGCVLTDVSVEDSVNLKPYSIGTESKIYKWLPPAKPIGIQDIKSESVRALAFGEKRFFATDSSGIFELPNEGIDHPFKLPRTGVHLLASNPSGDQLAATGVLTKRSPTDVELENVDYGLHIAGEIARLDLGQTIVVRGKACVAVEAMEGTDATIKRAGELANGKLTVVKVAKPGQDMRFDVPVVGLPTIEAMIAAGATCLSVTAGKTLIFDREEMITLADRNKIAVVGSVFETIGIRQA